MIDYTPDTKEVREDFAHWYGDDVQERRDAFDRWYAAEIRTAQAEAWAEGAEAAAMAVPEDIWHALELDIPQNPYTEES